MMRPDTIPATKVRNFAHRTLKALGFVNINLLFKRPHPEPVAPTTELPASAAERCGDLPAAHHPARPATAGDLQMPTGDWDLLFRAILLRLRAAVGDRPESAPPPQAGDPAGNVQVAVLECIGAMEQLHAALARERQARVGAAACALSVDAGPVLFAGRLG